MAAIEALEDIIEMNDRYSDIKIEQILAQKREEKEERLKLFLNIFFNLPYENKDDDDKDLKLFIIELHYTQLHNEKVQSNILTYLISKLHGCINQLEQFSIRVNDVAGRPVHSSALRLISTPQLKCNLVRHPQCKTLKQWNSGPVKIGPFALVSAIEKYLLLRGVASSSSVKAFFYKD